MRMYHREGAGRPIRLAWTLEELDLPYDLQIMSREEGRAAEHLARHPLGRVPVLADDEGPLFESTALCLHAADLVPQAGLIPPPGSRDRALVYQWAFFAMTEIEPAALDRYRYGESAPDVAAAAGNRARAAADAAVAALDGREFIVGDRFTVADIIVSEVIRIARRIGVVDLDSPDSPVPERDEGAPGLRTRRGQAHADADAGAGGAH